MDRGIFVTPFHKLRAVKTQIGKSPVCWAAGLGVNEVELETRPRDAMDSCDSLVRYKTQGYNDLDPLSPTLFSARLTS